MLLSQPATQQIVSSLPLFWRWTRKTCDTEARKKKLKGTVRNSWVFAPQQLSWIHSLSYLVSYLQLGPCTKRVTCCISDQRTFVIHGYLRWTCPLENVHLDVPFLIPPEDLTLVGWRALRVCAGSTEFTNILFSNSFVPDGWVGSPSAAAYQFEMRSVST